MIEGCRRSQEKESSEREERPPRAAQLRVKQRFCAGYSKTQVDGRCSDALCTEAHQRNGSSSPTHNPFLDLMHRAPAITPGIEEYMRDNAVPTKAVDSNSPTHNPFLDLMHRAPASTPGIEEYMQMDHLFREVDARGPGCSSAPRARPPRLPCRLRGAA